MKLKPIILGVHQNDGKSAIINYKGVRCLILMPTSTGKTFTFGAALFEDLPKIKSISVLATHRIDVTDQQIDELKVLRRHNYSHVSMSDILIHSGKPEDVEVTFNWYRELIADSRAAGVYPERATKANKRERSKLIRKAKLALCDSVPTMPVGKLGSILEEKFAETDHVIIGCVYNSLPKVEKVIEDLGLTDRLNYFIADEVHKMTERHFAVSLDPTKPEIYRKRVGTTATAIHTDTGIDMIDEDGLINYEEFIDLDQPIEPQIDQLVHGNGMSNISRFGPVVYRYTERAAIDDGEMCPVRADFIKSDQSFNDRVDRKKSIPVAVYKTFNTHAENLLKQAKLSGRYENAMPQMLFTMTGKDIGNFINSQQYRSLLEEHPDLTIASVHSVPHWVTVSSGTEYKIITRLEFKKVMKKFRKQNKPILLLNNDILTTGWNLPSLNGGAIFKNIDKWSNFKQNIGRFIRLWRDENREPDFDVKPCGWLYLLDKPDDDAAVRRYGKWLANLYAEGLIPEMQMQTEEAGDTDRRSVIPEDYDHTRMVRTNEEIEFEFLQHVIKMNLPDRYKKVNSMDVHPGFGIN